MSTSLPAGLRLESLEVGAVPLVRHFLDSLQLPSLFDRFLPKLGGRPAALKPSVSLCTLLCNLLLARRPLYDLPAWIARRVPEHLGLTAQQVGLLNDDRIGSALDHLYSADRASLLTALVRQAVTAFEIRLDELHQDTTTVSLHGEYPNQPAAEVLDRPAHITFGYNKDHRPDLKQLLFSITITSDEAVPIHCKTYDGNTNDDSVHVETWDFLRRIIGHTDFLYVADCKLCTKQNMAHIDTPQGRFLTVMPKTRKEDAFFRDYQYGHSLQWVEVRREANPRGGDEEVVYDAVESPSLSEEGYRVLWYRSSQKAQHDQASRQQRLERAHAAVEALGGRRREYDSEAEARTAAKAVVQAQGVEKLVRVGVDSIVHEEFRQEGPGRPGPETKYRRIERTTYRARLVEDAEGIRREASSDGMFPLMTNDKKLSLQEALEKYKYQPFVEKRHQQLKSGFSVVPMWLKSSKRIESMLWLYYAVELIQALLERGVRGAMADCGRSSMRLYPEGRPSEAPTAMLVIRALEGQRRHRLLDKQGQELQRFHDELPRAAREVLDLLGVDLSPYGLS